MTLLVTIKHALRTRRETGHPLVRLAIRLIDFVRAKTSPYIRFVTDRRFRATTMLRWFKGDRFHQSEPFTCMDRYPQIFDVCRNFFSDRQAIKVLSFGCSSGEEVLTIRGHFPEAYIVGAEINPVSLALCRKQPIDEKMDFVVSDPDAIRKRGPFDLIFCMAVLQRTPRQFESRGIVNLKKLYPFEKFDRQVSELDSYLNPDGLLVIHHTQYFFEDSSVAEKYELVDVPDLKSMTQWKFDRNSALIENAAVGGSVFRKIR